LSVRSGERGEGRGERKYQSPNVFFGKPHFSRHTRFGTKIA
jgi:hypothetical protein